MKPEIIDQEAEKIVDFVSFHTINWENKFSWVEDDLSPASPVNEFYQSDELLLPNIEPGSWIIVHSVADLNPYQSKQIIKNQIQPKRAK